MPEKAEALAILFVLLPGFLCAYITQSLAVRRQQTDTEKIVEALIFSLVLYLITLPHFGFTLPIHWQDVGHGVFQVVADYPHLITLFGLSLALGTLYAANINHDWLMGLMRWANVTERTARTSIWNDAFQEISGWVQVGFDDGTQMRGWVRYYSDEAGDSSLFLERAAWIDGEDREEIDGPGILITAAATIKTITFLGPSEDEADSSPLSISEQQDKPAEQDLSSPL
jgi:hypothetical protein